jgi:hypothetical protein
LKIVEFEYIVHTTQGKMKSILRTMLSKVYLGENENHKEELKKLRKKDTLAFESCRSIINSPASLNLQKKEESENDQRWNKHPAK